MKLRPAVEQDRDAILALLESESLPTSDLDGRSLEHFIVAEDGASVVGCIGAEIHGATALLRSLVVGRSSRRAGLAGRLVRLLELQLPDRGVLDVWLLTIDADEYFLRHGYQVRSREDVPAEIRQTDEFSSLCPGSASLMHKSLRHA
ncbi:MAG: arsenic resistance N-acetyltransferase ArsN2 [Woeseiaceae bacterium]|nr:arsenic resistance N-acetyltransferase ArsN2 [Woeseiaceae bacterium]